MSAITQSFVKELQLEVKKLDKLLDIEGTGGSLVPYYGYIELQLKIPQIKKFDLDVLMLVIDDSPYGARVPVQIGTLHIDMMLDLASEEEKRKLNHQSERACVAQNLHMASLQAETSGKETFKLQEVKGSVHSTGTLKLKPFEVVTVSGVMKGPARESGFYKRVNVALEPIEEQKSGRSCLSSVPGCTYLKLGSNRVQVMLKNMSARMVTVHPEDRLDNFEAANVVPHMLAPKEAPSDSGNSQFEQGARTGRFEEHVRSCSSDAEPRSEVD